MFGPDHASKWSGPDPWTGWKLTPMITGIAQFGPPRTYRSKNVKQIRPN